MGLYKDLVHANYAKVKGDDKVMWQSVEIIDAMLEDMKEHHKEKYWQIMRDTHEVMFGKHFDEGYATWEVEQMHHTSPDGKVYKGEHWSKSQTNEVMQKYRGKLSPEITPCDFYVALNAQWHDYICWAKDKFATEPEAEAAVIEMAVRFWFMDDDWGTPTKVWEYFRMKR